MEQEHLPDFHERGEARAERWVENDKVRCAGCNGLFDFSEVECSSVDPYSPPICGDCLCVIRL